MGSTDAGRGVTPDDATTSGGNVLIPQDPIRIVDWADGVVGETGTSLHVHHGPRPSAVHGANATGEALVTNGALGADLIRLGAGQGFSPHTHPGDHLLVVVAGEGTITYDGRVVPTRAGQIYLVEGLVPHAVGAITDHVIMAIGSPHRRIDAADRMALVEYTEVTSEPGDLTCLICDLGVTGATRLHDVGCLHCPCRDCVEASWAGGAGS